MGNVVFIAENDPVVAAAIGRLVVGEKMDDVCAAGPDGHAPAGAKILSLSAGPVRAGALLEQIQAVLAANRAQDDHLALGGHTIDARAMRFTRADGTIFKLTEKETGILMMLARAGGSVVDRRLILDTVWGYAQNVETHTLETHIYRLRQKIEHDPAAPAIILTDDAGYKMGG